jgi:hypothetical protein
MSGPWSTLVGGEATSHHFLFTFAPKLDFGWRADDTARQEKVQ